MDGGHQDRAHAKLSASGAHRWMACPGSVSLEAEIPNTSSPHAEEGTAAHELAEAALRQLKDAADFKGEMFNGFIADDEMCENVQVYLDYVRSKPGKFFCEKRISFEEWVPGGFGTADAITLGEDGTLYVSDLKYGKGVRVDAEWNPQGLLYALGAAVAFEMVWDVSKIQIAIVQPRLDHISEFEISHDDLIDWANSKVADAVTGAMADDPVFNPSEKACQWCRAKGECRALADFNLQLAGEEFANVAAAAGVAFSDAKTLANEEIAAVLPHLKLLTKWADAVEAKAFEELTAGRDVPGFKLVEGRALRKWADEEEAATKLSRKIGKAEAYKSTLITPAQAEKKIGGDAGKKWVAKFAAKPEGKPTLAPESDKRPAVGVNVEDEFANIAAE